MHYCTRHGLVIAFTVLLVAVTNAAFNITAEQKEKVEKVKKICAAETEVDEDILKKAREGDVSDLPKFKEHLFCVFRKSGYQDDSGEVQHDVVREKVGELIQDPDMAKNVTEKCLSGKGPDVAYNFVKCIFTSFPDFASYAFQ